MHLLLAVVLLTTTGVAAARADDAITPAPRSAHASSVSRTRRG